jgi:hypothetical protein
MQCDLKSAAAWLRTWLIFTNLSLFQVVLDHTNWETAVPREKPIGGFRRKLRLG